MSLKDRLEKVKYQSMFKFSHSLSAVLGQVASVSKLLKELQETNLDSENGGGLEFVSSLVRYLNLDHTHMNSAGRNQDLSLGISTHFSNLLSLVITVQSVLKSSKRSDS